MPQSQIAVVHPQRIGCDVLHDDRCAAVCGCPAGARRCSDHGAIDRIDIGLGKASCAAMPQTIAVQQQDGREGTAGLVLDESAQAI